jgi:hypothetical protein
MFNICSQICSITSMLKSKDVEDTANEHKDIYYPNIF